MKIYAQRAPIYMSNVISLFVTTKVGAVNFVADKPTMKEVPTGEIATPSIEMEMGEAQFLIDQLWDCGLRPTEGSGSAGALAATQRHLDDMRKLVFKE